MIKVELYYKRLFFKLGETSSVNNSSIVKLTNTNIYTNTLIKQIFSIFFYFDHNYKSKNK